MTFFAATQVRVMHWRSGRSCVCALRSAAGGGERGASGVTKRGVAWPLRTVFGALKLNKKGTHAVLHHVHLIVAHQLRKRQRHAVSRC